MAFRFKLEEPIQKGFRRIGCEQIDRALGELSAGLNLPAEIHEARKCLKRVRALLRLGREGLGTEIFRIENRRFSDIAGRLAPARDDHVLCETLLKLEAAESDDRTRRALSRVRVLFLAGRAESARTDTDSSAVGEVMDALADARDRFGTLSFKPATTDTLVSGLVHNYRRARKAMAAAYETNEDEAFHTWRKGVQAHWRHTSLLSRLWPDLMDVRVGAARELSQILGDDHDLSILRDRIYSVVEDAPLSPDETDAVLTLIGARQDGLRRIAKPRGEMLLAASPKAHGRWIAALWTAARERAKCDKTVQDLDLDDANSEKKRAFSRT